ncbi:MAG TPA: serine/threonine protein kinase, partial [Thermodesulfobacteriota bacterium]|nr:serine/threonine protein kinase [Thermodesulfobacteriota bacterium]
MRRTARWLFGLVATGAALFVHWLPAPQQAARSSSQATPSRTAGGAPTPAAPAARPATDLVPAGSP